MVSKISQLQPKILKILRKNDVKRAGIFGSYARGEQKKTSDLDILIEFKGKKSLLDLAGLELKLEKMLRQKVDLLTYKSLHPLLKKQILSEEIRIL